MWAQMDTQTHASLCQLFLKHPQRNGWKTPLDPFTSCLISCSHTGYFVSRKTITTCQRQRYSAVISVLTGLSEYKFQWAENGPEWYAECPADIAGHHCCTLRSCKQTKSVLVPVQVCLSVSGKNWQWREPICQSPWERHRHICRWNTVVWTVIGNHVPVREPSVTFQHAPRQCSVTL